MADFPNLTQCVHVKQSSLPIASGAVMLRAMREKDPAYEREINDTVALCPVCFSLIAKMVFSMTSGEAGASV